MSDAWMPTLKLNLTRDEFHALPRHPAFKYELLESETRISPRPRYANASLTLRRFRPAQADLGRAELRPIDAADREALLPTFLGAFGQLQPFGSLPDDKAR